MQLQVAVQNEDNHEQQATAEAKGPFHQAISPIPLIVHDIDSSDYSSDEDFAHGSDGSHMMENLGTTPSLENEDEEAKDSPVMADGTNHAPSQVNNTNDGYVKGQLFKNIVFIVGEKQVDDSSDE